MRWKAITIRFASILVVVLTGSVVLAQTGSGFDLSWHVIGGGGASGPLTGSGFSVGSTLGQLAIGPASGAPYELGAGFWYGAGGKFRIYLPLVLRQYSSFSDPYEPNDSFEQAWGPLNSGETYNAYFPATSDMDDYYYFDMGANHSIDISLTNIPSGNDYDLTLYDAAHVEIGHSGTIGSGDEHINLGSRPAGRYYIRISRIEGTSDTQPYALRAVYQ